MTDQWNGTANRECGEHLDYGERSRCLDCNEWCADDPDFMCKGCEMPGLRAALVSEHERLYAAERTVREQRGHIVGALRELCIPGPDYPAPVANAVAILAAALAPDTEGEG